MSKLNFGCGANRLDGWENFDSEVDITKRLPQSDACADFILAEHVVEHVPYKSALDFFKECHRVLKPGGVARIITPSIERIWCFGTKDYFEFVRRWGPSADRRGATRIAWRESAAASHG